MSNVANPQNNRVPGPPKVPDMNRTPPDKARGSDKTSPDESQPKRSSPFRSARFWIMFGVLLLMNMVLTPIIFPEAQDRLTISYTFFTQQVTAGNVAEITSRGEDIQGTFKQSVAAQQDPVNAQTTPTAAPSLPFFGSENQADKTFTKFATVKPAFVDQELLSLLQQNNVVITAEPLEQRRSPITSFLLAFGPTLLLLFGFLWLNNRMLKSAGGGAFSLGNSRAKRYDAVATERPVNFEDVAGIDEVERELSEIVDFLKNPQKYKQLGGRIPRGVLLIGPPGTGKTLLARAVAGEANVPFFSMSGSEFVEMVVGVGAARVRDLFVQARKSSPSIIFVDELDAIGRKRGSNALGGNDEREQTLNQLLIEMDGFDERTTVIVLAATNRADVLDPALLRPGRFDRRVTVQSPDKTGRTEILKIHTREIPLAAEVKLDGIAAATPGATGAELANLANEAALTAARKGHTAVTQDDFAEALEKIVLGAERHILLDPKERERVAYHESGHALCGLLQPESDPVRRVTVVPRAQALGVTLSVPEADRYNYTEGYLRARIVNALGGRAAEQVVYGNITTGAENDLQQVTDLARAMVTRFGMSQEVGQVALSGNNPENFLESGLATNSSRPYSEATAQAVDRAVRRIVDDSYAKAVQLLSDNRQRLDALAQALLNEDSLDEREMREVTGLMAGKSQERAVGALS